MIRWEIHFRTNTHFFLHTLCCTIIWCPSILSHSRFLLIPSDSPEERGRVMDCSSGSWGYLHTGEEPYAFRGCDRSPQRSPLQLHMPSKSKGFKQNMGTPWDRLHLLWTWTESSTTTGSYMCPLSFKVPCTRHRRIGARQ